MTDKLKETIEEEVVKMPREFQEAFTASNWIPVSEDIARKYKLYLDEEINKFQAEVFLVLSGVVQFELLSVNIENELGLSKEEAEKIEGEVLERVIFPFSSNLESKAEWKMDIKNSKWDQNLDFITSGGDYSAFLDIKKSSPDLTTTETKSETNQSNPSV
ncbi:MAG: hypothetical protein KBC12_00355 [Candidatus Pacebacteria bacterium]|nr:hypothetical protein [Candidatus Paceibacterota bacterium]MBP9851104.1 hypothetical protein [Candidatus Paceibacterota bacterium]